MSITRAPFGALPDGRPVERITLEGRNGLSASILTYGATLQSLCFDGRDVVLGYDSLEDYRRCGGYQGATIGRYGNRIAGGRFALGGTTYDVGCNESGRGHLHGGETGFDKYIWDAEILSDDGEPSVRFSLVSADGDMGYPGRLTVSVTFTVRDENALELAYRAVSDKDTVLNLPNHAYFNLNGYDGGDILDNVLTIDADAITPVDGKLIPTGEFLAVEGTPFDFREGKPIGQDIEDPLPQLRLGGGYDHNYVLNGSGFRRVLSAFAPKTGIRMDCLTDQPGVQFYTANGLKTNVGKGGAGLYRHQGFCLETQHFPDSPNRPQFPSTLLKAGDLFESVTQYVFSKA